MYTPTTCEDSRRFTSSPESASGLTPFARLVGKMTVLYGRAPALASRSQLPATEQAWMTSAISGRTCSDSSKHIDLPSLWESRLRARMGSPGSTLYKLTWKVRSTPHGRQIPALRASALPTSGNGSTGWATPSATDYKGGYQGGRIRNGVWSTDRLDVTAQLTGWPTPLATDSANGGKGRALRYKGTAPSEAGNTRNPDTLGSYRGELKDWVLHLTGWSTPTATDSNRGVKPPRPTDTGVPLTQVAGLSGWPTPVANDDNKTPEAHLAMKKRMGGNRTSITSLQVMSKYTEATRLTASGEILTGSSARMGAGVRLNPALPRWLMSLPPEWCQAAPVGAPQQARKGSAISRPKSRAMATLFAAFRQAPSSVQ